MEYILIRKNVRRKHYKTLFIDIPKLHEIRGRLINLSTILENHMKDYLRVRGKKPPRNLVGYIDPRTKQQVDGVFESYLNEINSDKSIRKTGIKSFKKHFLFIKKQRDSFAHGIVYYKNPKNLSQFKVNNALFNIDKDDEESLNKKKTVFDKLNTSYRYIFEWLEKKKLLGISGFKILKCESKTSIRNI